MISEKDKKEFLEYRKLKKAQKEEEDYLKSLYEQREKLQAPKAKSYEEAIERASPSQDPLTKAVFSAIGDKVSPLVMKDEDKGDYSPVDLTTEADAPMRALRTYGNISDRPVRRSVYELLGGEPKKEVEGEDVVKQLETHTGELPKGISYPLELAADFGLDIGTLAGIGPLGKLTGKLGKSKELLEHLDRIKADKMKKAQVLKETMNPPKPGKEVVMEENLPTKDQILKLL